MAIDRKDKNTESKDQNKGYGYGSFASSGTIEQLNMEDNSHREQQRTPLRRFLSGITQSLRRVPTNSSTIENDGNVEGSTLHIEEDNSINSGEESTSNSL